MKAVVIAALLTAACDGAAAPTAPTAPTATRIISVSGTLAFNQIVGASETATITISNSGNSALTVTNITGSGSLPAQSQLSWRAGAIAPGESQVVEVTFRPTTPGSFTGSLIVSADQTSGTNTLAYSAVAIPATPFMGSWSGTALVDGCQGGGSAQEMLCSARSDSRPGGLYPLGSRLPVTMALTQSGNAVSGTLTLGDLTGSVSGGVASNGLLTLRGTAARGPLAAAIVHWSSRVILGSNTMDGAAGYNVTGIGAPGVGVLVTSLTLTRQ